MAKNNLFNNSPVRQASCFIQSGGRDLQYLFTKAKHLAALNQKVVACLKPALAKYCQVAHLTGNKLILIAANGSAATQLRFESESLLRTFSQDPTLQHIQQIECKVRPVTTGVPPRLHANQPPENTPPLSPQTAKTILTTAKSINHSALREVMEQIASHTNLNKA